MNKIFQFIVTNYPYLLGGIGGASLTIIYNRWINRIKVMHCYYIDEDTITKIPVVTENGEQHKNIYTKEFKLKNTTGKDIDSFKIVFEFDADAKIIKQDTFHKAGKNELKGKNKKPNECVYTIKKLNRDDEISFYFDIANVTNDFYNVTEIDCVGFKISVKDKRKAQIKGKAQVVTKDKIK